MKYAIGFIGFLIGGAASFGLFTYLNRPPVVVGSAEDCIHDGYIVHDDGSKTINWVCTDPTK